MALHYGIECLLDIYCDECYDPPSGERFLDIIDKGGDQIGR